MVKLQGTNITMTRGDTARVQVSIANPDGTVTVGKKLVFTVVFDHRALDMGDVVPFLKSIDETFKNPEVIKEWI